jgi:hypothetical protein
MFLVGREDEARREQRRELRRESGKWERNEFVRCELRRMKRMVSGVKKKG